MYLEFLAGAKATKNNIPCEVSPHRELVMPLIDRKKEDIDIPLYDTYIEYSSITIYVYIKGVALK